MSDVHHTSRKAICSVGQKAADGTGRSGYAPTGVPGTSSQAGHHRGRRHKTSPLNFLTESELNRPRWQHRPPSGPSAGRSSWACTNRSKRSCVADDGLRLAGTRSAAMFPLSLDAVSYTYSKDRS